MKSRGSPVTVSRSPAGMARHAFALVLACNLLGCGGDPAHPAPGTHSQGAQGTRAAEGGLATPGGEKVFRAYCAPCHHVDGIGGENGAPPFVGSPWIYSSDGRLSRIVLQGLRGPLEVGAKEYNLEMPGFGNVLSDEQIAEVLTHVRMRFGNGGSAITPQGVARARAESRDRRQLWTAAELKSACP